MDAIFDRVVREFFQIQPYLFGKMAVQDGIWQ